MSRPPDYIHLLIQALRYRDARPEGLSRLSDSDWSALLAFSDKMRLTLPLAQAAEAHLPSWVQDRLSLNLTHNRARFERIQADYLRIAEAFRSEQIDHLVLKGFAQWPQAGDFRKRVQYDIDLYCPANTVFCARDVLDSLGYQAVRGFEHSPSDHLPVMIRPSNWRWHGDFFDPDLPIPVDLHFQFWNED